jgi:cellulose synthase/poly-beta-1,6-N-acetylglucosamine synthase-like glycosyltransferase
MVLFNAFLGLIFIYVSISVVYAFVFALAGRLGKTKSTPSSTSYRRFAVFIPSYKEDEVILNTAKEALKQTYPTEYFDVVVIADSLKPASIELLKAMPVKLVEVSFDLSTKAKSINEAFNVLPEIYDYVLILDADNIMAPDFIDKLNSRLVYTGVKAIQGHRVAKNLNTKFAVLDAISEEINNHVYRKGHRVLGFSSGLIGSGMAFDYRYYKSLMKTNNAIGGFDKESELKILRDGLEIEYVEDAYVYDEKVENSEVFKNQRRRWISAQLHYFRKYFLSGFYHLITKGNYDFFDKAFQQFLLPRMLLLGFVVLMAFISGCLKSAFAFDLFPGVYFWVGLAVMKCGSVFLSIPNKYYNKQTLNAALELPKVLILMFLTLFKLKGANKKFIHTPHSGSVIINSEEEVESGVK